MGRGEVSENRGIRWRGMRGTIHRTMVAVEEQYRDAQPIRTLCGRSLVLLPMRFKEDDVPCKRCEAKVAAS